jgi:hypothetical protein
MSLVRRPSGRLLAVVAKMVQRETVAKEFLERNKPLIEEAIKKVRDVTRITRLEDEVASEPMTVLTKRTLRRSASIEATVALEGANQETYRDLRIAKVSAF